MVGIIKKRNLRAAFLRNASNAALLCFFIAFSLIFESCTRSSGLKIALSKGSGGDHYSAYSEWLKSIDDDVEIVDLFGMEPGEAARELRTCAGLVLTGGPDVAPGRYGNPLDSPRCQIDYERDTLEFRLIKEAMNLRTPILCICRGEQILNVALGGSLIVDIPMDFDRTVTHRNSDPGHCSHEIEISEGSLLHRITGVRSGSVNSNHHQAVRDLADGMIASAQSPDGLIEAYEWKNQKGRPFMLAVQWHPERLEPSNPLSKPIGKYFLKKAGNYKNMAQK